MGPWIVRMTVLLAVAGAGYGGYVWYNRPDPSKAPKLEKVVRGDIVVTATVNGMVTPKHTALIVAPYSGYVHRLFVTVGEHIKAGDPVVSLTQTAVPTGEAVFPQRSPLTGIVSQISYSQGEFVDIRSTQPGRNANIVRIDDTSSFLVTALAPEIEYGKLKKGQEAGVKINAASDKIFKGIVESLALSPREQNMWERSRVEFPVEIRILNPDATVRPGMSAIVDVTVRKAENVLKLPHEFIDREGAKYFVTKADGGKQFIEVGIQNDEGFEIKSGVPEGEEVRQVDFLKLGKS